MRIQLPSEATELRLDCGSAISVRGCIVDGLPVTPLRDGDAADEVVVPERWRHTRDFGSYKSCHGAATFNGSYQFWDEATSGRCFYGGQLAIPIPSPMVGTEAAERLLDVHLEYVITDAKRGGVHFVRGPGRGAKAIYAHTIGEAGAARRWMPCVDCVQIRCPIELHVTTDANLQVHATGQPIGDASASDVNGLRTWSYTLDHSVTASQIGFVVGRLISLQHPTMPSVKLVLGTLEEAASDARWPQMIYLARQLPSLFQFLRSHLLGPSAAVAAEEALAAEDAAEAAGLANGEAPAVRRHPSSFLKPRAWGRKGDDAVSDPFPQHTIVALEGCFEETAAFAGLILLSAHLLHPPEVIEPARPLRVAVGRALGRSWLASGVWLASWQDAWLLMALEGRLVHGLVAHEFGDDEAAHHLAEERSELCRSSLSEAAVALVPDDAELDKWGGGLHPEQLYSAYRLRKAPLVWSMLENAVVRTDGGKKAFTRILSKLMVFPPRDVSTEASAAGNATLPASTQTIPDRIRSTEGLLLACIAAGGKLGSLPSEWIFSSKPCPTLCANFIYIERDQKVELVIDQPKPEQAAKLGAMTLTVGWGEEDGDGAVERTLNPPVRLKDPGLGRTETVEFKPNRSSRRKRRGANAEGDEQQDEAKHLLWVRIDPLMELPFSVKWTGRPEELKWTGMPERMCADQLKMDRHVPSRIEAAYALATFQSEAAINSLATCIGDKSVYFRVRVAAAVALGSMVGQETGDKALTKLIELLKEAHFEDSRMLKPNDFSDLGEYALLKASIEAIGTCRDGEGRTPPEAWSLLIELLEDNDNTSNDYADSYYLGALLHALAATHTGEKGASRTITEQAKRLLRIDELRKSHERVITRAALQALATVELERSRRVKAAKVADVMDDDAVGVEASWATYWHFETYGDCAALRLTAADCLLRLNLVLQPSEVPSWHPVEAKECKLVLGLAHRLAASRAHAPLEQLWMWSALLALLSDPDHAEGVARERERLNAPGDPDSFAAVQLLWHGMTIGSAGHARLRYVLCEVWLCLFGEDAPGCLPFTPQPIGTEQIDAFPAAFVPLHAMRRQKREREEEKNASKMETDRARNVVKLGKWKGASANTRLDQKSDRSNDGPLESVTFTCPSVAEEDRQKAILAALPDWLAEYCEQAEKKVTYGESGTLARQVSITVVGGGEVPDPLPLPLP